MSFSGKVRHFMKDQKKYDAYIRDVADRYRMPRIFVRLDSLWCRLIYGASLANYINFEMYGMNARERDQFMTDARTGKILAGLNKATPQEMDTLGNKHVFNRLYSRYVHRQWAYGPESTDEEILQLLRDHDYLIVKPVDQMQGEGIRKVNCREILQHSDDFLAETRRDRLLVEEVVKQHPDLETLNPSSLNTLRVATVRSRTGQVLIVGASLRVGGAGSIVDNLHAGGVQYPVDPETGIVSRGGVTFNGEKGILIHPSTHQKVIGFQVPHWDLVVKTVVEAAGIPENIRYIGWDVAVTADGCEIIEGNSLQGCNGMQLDGVGKYRWLREYL